MPEILNALMRLRKNCYSLQFKGKCSQIFIHVLLLHKLGFKILDFFDLKKSKQIRKIEGNFQNFYKKIAAHKTTNIETLLIRMQ